MIMVNNKMNLQNVGMSRRNTVAIMRAFNTSMCEQYLLVLGLSIYYMWNTRFTEKYLKNFFFIPITSFELKENYL